MLGLESIVHVLRSGVDGATFAFHSQTLASLALAGAASLVASVTATVQRGATYAHALRSLFDALMTDCGGSGAPTTTVDGHLFETWPAFPGVAELLAGVSA